MTEVKFLSIPYLPQDYSHVMDFESREIQQSWFDNQVLLTLNCNIKYDSLRTYIVLNKPIQEVRSNYDYIFFDDGGRRFYYFITDYEVVSQNNTCIYLKLDVWSTYYFNHTVLSSFVDRCHVPRWIGDVPTSNWEDEGLDTGELIQIEEPTEICTMEKTIIITSSVPMGYVPKSTSGGGDITDDTISWTQGKVSSKCFRFLKGMEAYAPYPYQDSGGYWTIAYGISQVGNPTLYTELSAKAPVSEEECAKVSYDLKNSNYGAKILSACINLGVTKQYQFDALCSLAYNCGTGVVTGDNDLTRAIANNINDETTIRSVWENFYITSNGQELEGLKARRKEECNMFFGQEFEVRPILKIAQDGSYDGYVTENNGDGWLPSDTEISNNEGDFNGYKSFSNDFGSGYLCPVKGATVTSVYGYRTHPVTGVKTFHHGTDIGIAKGSNTVASKTGTITQTGYDSSMGNYIYLDTDDGYRIKYMHLHEIKVSQGDRVIRGQVVGLIGSTGSSTGPHCHWEIRRLSDNVSCNPAPSLKVGDKV